jgi:hypothetical protein
MDPVQGNATSRRKPIHARRDLSIAMEMARERISRLPHRSLGAGRRRYLQDQLGGVSTSAQPNDSSSTDIFNETFNRVARNGYSHGKIRQQTHRLSPLWRSGNSGPPVQVPGEPRSVQHVPHRPSIVPSFDQDQASNHGRYGQWNPALGLGRKCIGILRVTSQRVTQRYRDSAQTRIGYNLLLRGVLTSDWSERQQVYIIEVNRGVRGTEADTWSSKLSTWLINQAHNLWKARNEELHRPTAPDNSQIARAALELQERVRELYEQKDDVNYQDRDLFEIPLESRLQQSVSIMRAWVESTSKTLGICMEDFATATARGNSDIRDHLPIRARATASAPVAVQPEPTGSTRAAAAMRERPEVHELVDTSSTDSTMDSSMSSASSGLQKMRAMFNRALGRPKRR